MTLNIPELSINKLTFHEKVGLIDHYRNNAESLFGCWGMAETSVEYEDAWQTTYDTLGQKLGYHSKENMQRHLKNWLGVLEEKMAKSSETGDAFLHQFNKLETTLYNLKKKLPKKSTFNHHSFIQNSGKPKLTTSNFGLIIKPFCCTVCQTEFRKRLNCANHIFGKY